MASARPAGLRHGMGRWSASRRTSQSEGGKPWLEPVTLDAALPLLERHRRCSLLSPRGTLPAIKKGVGSHPDAACFQSEGLGTAWTHHPGTSTPELVCPGNALGPVCVAMLSYRSGAQA